MPRKFLVVVDDSPEFLSSATALLQELNGGSWDLSTCPSGGEAMALLQQSPV